MYSSSLKRLFDLLVTIPALLLLAPLLAFVALLVRLELGAPVLFRQQRPGLHGKPFTLYKFRTMTDTRDADGNLLPDAVRLTLFGRFLRSSSLDELPELFNVLKGDMSLVGPRPALHNQHDLIALRTRAGIHTLRPGLTGWAQINGRDVLPIAQKVAMDVHYLQQQSFCWDLRILLLTAIQVLRRDGITH